MRNLFSFLVIFSFAAVGFGETSKITYSVPVPIELKEHNHWILEENTVTVKLENKTLSVSYPLPLELVGKKAPEKFEFVGNTSRGSDFVSVRGENVYGVCMFSQKKPLMCMLKYPNLEVDTTSRDAALEKHFQGEELVARKKVVTLFGTDPAGVLSVPLK